MSNVATALLGAAILLASGPAQAADPVSDVTVTRQVVHVRDLDLFSDGGRRLLEQRIERAARLVCRDARSDFGLGAERDCFERALASGQRQRDRLFAARGLIRDYRSASAVR